MKRILMTSLILTFAMTAAMAGDGTGQPLLQKGKVWNYDYTYVDISFQRHHSSATYWTEGDTIVDGRRLFRMCFSNSEKEGQVFRQLWYEKDGKVYTCDDKGRTADLVYDFTLSAGDDAPDHTVSAFFPDGFKVVSSDSILVRGILRKRLVLTNPGHNEKVVWVEGIGGTKGLDEPIMRMVGDGREYTLLSCYLDDECIFEKEDFDAPPYRHDPYTDMLAEDLPVSDTKSSGCTSHSRGYGGESQPTPTIILEKEGNILSVQVLNFVSNCATSDFEVKSSIYEGSSDSPCSLQVKVTPVTGDELADCICQFNVSFTIHDVEQNTFYLDCWWYKGLVELMEGEPLVLADVYEDATIEGMNYTLRKAFHQATVAKSDWAGELHIPSELTYEGQTYTVTSIDADAFRDNTALTKVMIPQTVKSMGFDVEYGFYRNLFVGCTALEKIEVEEGNPVLSAVDGVLFNKEKTRLYAYPIAASRTSYTVPEGVTWIEGEAFAYNPHLVKVSLPDDVTDLGFSAFYGCTNLEEVRLSSRLKILAGWLFGNCEHLKSVTIPQGVTFLGVRLFSGCSSLTSVVMPESVTSTDDAIFENCTSLKNVTLSSNLDRINYQLFLNCVSMNEIQIPKGVSWVFSNAFQNCSALKTLDLPKSVCRLGGSAFSGCKLDSLLIRGIIDSYWVSDELFHDMGTQTKIYVQPSEVEKFQKIYKGTVYPLTDQMNGISYTLSPVSNSSELFDLQGRRLMGTPQKGVYIQNGRKYVK